jgi:GTP-binding protein
LVVVVDMAGADGRKPWEDYRTVLREMELHDRTLLDRPRLVAANKMDEDAAAANCRSFRRRIPKIRMIKMAAAFGEGIEEFKEVLKGLISRTAD